MKKYGTYLFLIVFIFLPAQEIDSLRRQLVYAKTDTAKVWIHRDLAFYYQSINTDSAIYFANRGVDLSRFLNFSKGEVWCMYQKALAYENQNKLDSAFQIYDDAIDIATKHNDALSKAKLLNAIGVTHYYAGNLKDALDYYQRGLDWSMELGYSEGISYALNNMGVIYRMQSRFNKALEIYNKSLDIKKQENDTIGIISSLYNKGLCYSYLKKFNESLETFQKSEEFSKFIDPDHPLIPNTAIGKGVALFNLGEHDQAKEYLKSGIKQLQQPTPEKISAMAYLGAIEVKAGNPKGLEKIEEAYEAIVNSGRKELLRTILKEKAIAAEILSNHKMAGESWKEYSHISDSINMESSLWAIEEMQAKFELKDKENTIALQQLEIEKESAKKKRYLHSGLFLLVVVVGGSFFMSKIMKQRKQLADLIHIKDKVIDTNELLLQEMHHRTKNNLQLLNSILNLNSRNAQSPAAIKALQSSRDSVGAISILHQQLYVNKDFRHVDFAQYIQDLCEYFRSAFMLKDRNITLKCDCKPLSLDIDQAIPSGLIINELITNSVKHAFPKCKPGYIHLKIDSTLTNIVLEVKDNGESDIELNHSEGTGKKLIDIFKHKYDGKFTYFNSGKGTIGRFSMPLKIRE